MMSFNNPNDMWQYDPYKGMSNNERMKTGCLQGIIYIVCVIFAFAVCGLLFTSCTTTQYVPVIEHHTDTLIQTKLQHDSIHVRDSIHVSEKGDTVRIERWHVQYVKKETRDTCYISRTDSVPMPYPVIKEVPRELSLMQRSLMTIGGMSLMVLLLFIGIKAKRFFRK